jgi:hypothetical protein
MRNDTMDRADDLADMPLQMQVDVFRQSAEEVDLLACKFACREHQAGFRHLADVWRASADAADDELLETPTRRPAGYSSH